MIILLDKPNQLCNRLWSQAPLIAYCFVENEKILIPTFSKYSHLFENLNKYEQVHFMTKKRPAFLMLLKGLYKCFKLIPGSILALFNVFIGLKTSANYQYSYKFLKQMRKVYFASGWNSNAFNKQLQANHQKLREIYEPKACSKLKVDRFFLELKSKFDIVIGVHIRKGDYRQWKNGKYYFDNEVYLAYMQQLQSQLQAQNKRICFLLCSNEALDLSDFADLKVFQIEEVDAIEDLYGLSLSDYIIGPPSTYSMWASFYGKKPLYFIEEREGYIDFDAFSIIVAQNIFENGKKAF